MHLVDLISFNCFEFEVLVSELLTNLSAFLMVIEFLLALNLLVFIDLHLEQLRMMFELLFLLPITLLVVVAFKCLFRRFFNKACTNEADDEADDDE